jgi:hypothetical protein
MTFNALYSGYIVPGSTLLPIGAGILYYKKLGKAVHALIIYLCIALLINIGGIIMASYNKNNLPLLHVYTAFEMVAVTWYYKRAFATKQADKWMRLIMIIYPILCIINFSFFQSIYTFNTYTRPLEAIIVIVFSGVYLSAPGTTNKNQLTASAGRWIASGFMLYFCTSLFQFVFSNVMHNHASREMRLLVWNIHDTFVLIMYIFFFIAIKHERGER